MGKKVMITGVNGFIGSHMAQKCLQSGYEVLGVDMQAVPSVGHLKYYQLNLYEDGMDDILMQYKPFALIHCAGMADVNYSVKHPDSDFASNVVISRKILYSLKNASPETVFVFLSSAGVYGNPEQNPITEEHARNPISPYALHKALVEDICQYFVKQSDMDIKILRIFSAYGSGLKKQIFWDMGQKIAASGRLEMFGTGEETRDFIHIADLVNAILLVLNAPREEKIVYNIANGQEIRIREVAERFCEGCGKNKDIIVFNNQKREGNPLNWCADISRLIKLGYKQEIGITEGIREYIGWLQDTQILK